MSIKPVLMQLIVDQKACSYPLVSYIARNAPDVLNRTDRRGYTATLLAAKLNLPSILSELLENGESPDIREISTVFGDTAISWAVYRGNYLCVEILLRYGADFNQRTLNDDKTLLMWAYNQRQDDVFQLLLSRGCCVWQLSRKGHCIMNSLVTEYKLIIDYHFERIRNIVLELCTLPIDMINIIMEYY